jgi:hypothetical protein
MRILRKIENALQTAIESSSALNLRDVQPLDIVRQIEREIERNKKIFIHDQTYVPHKMIIHLYAPTPAMVEEYEALFNNPKFQKYIEDYIQSKGYLLLDRIHVGIQCHREPIQQFKRRECFVEFSWPQASADPGEVTIFLDPENEKKIWSIQAPRDEVTQEAWLELLEGEAYCKTAKIMRREFNIGRGENVLNGKTGKLLRVNHLAFCKPGAADVVNRSVSRQHARIIYRDKSFIFYDTGSQNGTSVERGKTVLPLQRPTLEGDGVELHDEDVLVVGRARVAFHIGPMPSQASVKESETEQ